MLSAFQARPIVELKPRDKSRIESILSYGDRLLVGLSTGTLRVYLINESPIENLSPANGAAESADEQTAQPKQKIAELLREQEKFSKYKIEQLAIIKEANILVSLSNSYVSIHDLHSYELQEQLTNTRGATAFSVTSNIVKDPSTAVPGIVSRLAVAVKRRLILWAWHDMEIAGDTTEIALISSVRSLTWATGTKLVAGLSSGFVMVDVESQHVLSISGPGSIGGAPGQDSNRGMGMSTMSYIGVGLTSPKPLATALGVGEMLLARDVNTHFINREGEALGRRQIPWHVAPDAIGYSYPYLLALQEATKGVLEVRNPQTLTLLQSIGLPGANLLQVAQPNISLAHAGKGFLVASDRIIWRMGALPYDSQIDALVEDQQHDEAISLLGMLEDALLKNKEGMLREIKMQKAQKLFDAKKFRDALDLFAAVTAPPERVIGLYPKIIAGDLAIGQEEPQDRLIEDPPENPIKQNALKGHKKTDSAGSSLGNNPTITALRKVQADDKSETNSIKSDIEPMLRNTALTEKELRVAVRELQAFLADVRRRLQRFFNPDQSLKDISNLRSDEHGEDIDKIIANLLGLPLPERVEVGRKLMDTAVVVDTTLFRAHMYATPSLAGSLFRIANFCDAGVVMEKLQETGRYNDLVDFLFGKKLHRQALELLLKFGQGREQEDNGAQLRGPARTVSYLQSIPPEQVDMILEYAEWPIKADADLGMQIFLADTENAEMLPRAKVLEFLERMDKRLAMKYLEHVIHELNDLTPDLHQRLLILYFQQLRQPSNDDATGAQLQSQFLTLLRSSTQYSPAQVLGILPRDEPAFYEARAIVFSKMGQHKQALEIYVFKLNQPVKAEEYCNRIHLQEDKAATSQTPSRRKSTADPLDEQPSIYNTLLKLYLNPPKSEKRQWGPALEILARHGTRLPASSTLELLPETLPVKELEFYFRGRIRGANSIVNDSRVLSGLGRVDAVRVQAALLLGESGEAKRGRGRKVKVDEERVCGMCYKRLGGSVISVFPE